MRLVLVLLFSLVTSQVFASGKIAGKVADEKTGDVIIGATVMVQGTGKGTATDVDGRFLLEVPAGTYTVEIRYIGFQPKDISDVVVKEGEVTNLDAVIAEDNKTTLKDVVVTASLKKESVNALYIMQKNSVSLSSGISADVIQRTPDRNTGEVLKRVSGASVKDNKYVVIRGLSDRYNLAMVNSALMPSTEPDKKAFSFDVIPSNLIDNIIINKTASPDLPGDFAGGIVQVMTKDVPEKDFFNVGLGLGYNTQTTFKDFRSNDPQSAGLVRFPGSKAELPAEFGDSYKDYKKLSEDKQLDAARQLPNDYKETVAAAMPNLALQASYGKASNLKNGGKLGTVVGLSYRNQHNNIPEFIRGKYEKDFTLHSYSTDEMFRNSSNLAVLANFSYVKGKSKISFKNLYNKMYDNSYYERKGYTNSNKQQINGFSFIPSERQVFNTQLEGEHAIGTKNSKLSWNLNYNNLVVNQSDLRTAFYSRSANFDAQGEMASETSESFNIVDDATRRFFSNQIDHNMGAGVNYSQPFQAFGQKQTLKLGYMGVYKTRDFGARIFQYDTLAGADKTITAQPVDQIFSTSNIGPNHFHLEEMTNSSDKYYASGLLNAGYAMMDNNLGDKWRLTWGVRFESYVQSLQAVDHSTKIDQQDIFNDVLPSFNLSYNMSEKSKFRLGASRTVNRPEFREIAPFQFIDFENLWTIKGNEELKRGNINNVDLRYEYYPNPGEAITAGVFYKGFQNPIEAKMDDQSNLDLLIFTYQNAKAATTMGAEIDIRKTLAFVGEANWLENLTVGANFTYVHSRVDVSNITGVNTDRPLQGQSPYLANFSILYSDPKSGFGLSAMYNRIGQRIAVVGNSTIPTTWENGRDVIDLQISKSLLKNKAEIKLTVADLLNQPTTFYWNTDNKNSYTPGPSKVGIGNDQIFQQYRMGTTFTLGFNYRLGK